MYSFFKSSDSFFLGVPAISIVRFIRTEGAPAELSDIMKASAKSSAFFWRNEKKGLLKLGRPIF